MSVMVSQITGVSIVCSTVGSGVDQRKHQSSTSLAFVRGIHQWPVNSPHKRPVTRIMFPFDDVIMELAKAQQLNNFHKMVDISATCSRFASSQYLVVSVSYICFLYIIFALFNISADIMSTAATQYWLPSFMFFLWYLRPYWSRRHYSKRPPISLKSRSTVRSNAHCDKALKAALFVANCQHWVRSGYYGSSHALSCHHDTGYHELQDTPIATQS